MEKRLSLSPFTEVHVTVARDHFLPMTFMSVKQKCLWLLKFRKMGRNWYLDEYILGEQMDCSC